MEFKKIQNIISQVLQLDISEITFDADLVSDLCADSLEIFRIITEIEKEFDISVSDAALGSDRTAGALYQMIQNQR